MPEPIITEFQAVNGVTEVVDRIQGSLNSFGNNFGATSDRIRGAFGAMGLAASGFLFSSLHSFDESSNAAKSFARTLGSSTEQASGLIEAADDMGVSFGALQSAITTFQRKMAVAGDVEEIFQGQTDKAEEKVGKLEDALAEAEHKLVGYYEKIKSGKATEEEMSYEIENQKKKIIELSDKLEVAKEVLADGGAQMKGFKGALQELGISFNDSDGKAKPFNTILGEIADKFKEMPDGAYETRVAMMLFGAQGKSLIPLLNLGSEEIANMAAEAKKLGIVMTDDDVKASRALFVATDRLQDTMKGFQLNVIRPLVPDIVGFQAKVADLAGGMVEATNPFSEMIGKGMALVAVFGSLLGGSTFIYQLTTGFDSFKSILASMHVFLGPLGVLLAIIVALGIAWQTNFMGIQDKVIPIFNMLMEKIQLVKSFIESLINSTSTEEFGKRLKEGLSAFLDPAVAQKITEVSTKVVNFVKDVGAAMSSLFSGDMGGFKKGLTDAFDIVLGSGQSEKLVESVTQMFSLAAGAAKAAMSGDFGEAADYMFVALKQVLPSDMVKSVIDFGHTVESVIKNLQNGWQTALPIVERYVFAVAKDLIPAFVYFAAAIQGTVIPTIQNIIAAISDFIGDVSVRIGPALSNVIGAIAFIFQYIVSAINSHREDIVRVWKATWETLSGVVSAAWAIISGVIKIALDLLGGNFDLAGKDLQEMWKGIVDGLSQALDGLINLLGFLLTSLLASMKSMFARMLQAAIDFAAGVGNGIKEKLGEAANAIYQLLNSAAEGFMKIISSAISAIGNGSKNLVNAGATMVKSVVQGILEKIKDFITPWENAIKSIIAFFSEKLKPFKDAAVQLVVHFVDGFISMHVNAVNAVKDLWKKIQDEISTWPQKLYDWGVNMIKSFIAGLISMYEDFMAAIKKFGDAIPHSPAKVGPFSVTPDWTYMFEGLPVAVDNAVSDANKKLDRFTLPSSNFALSSSSSLGQGYQAIGSGQGKSIHVDKIEISVGNKEDGDAMRKKILETFDNLLG